jgi:hypothetical protein
MRLLETHAHRSLDRGPDIAVQPGSIGEALEKRERSDAPNQGRSLTAVPSASTRGAMREAVCDEMKVKAKRIISQASLNY